METWNNRTTQLFFKAYGAAKAAGIKMRDPKPDINQLSWASRDHGSYDLQKYDQGYFVTLSYVGLFGMRNVFSDSVFAVEGYQSLVKGSGYLKKGSEKPFESLGKISANCVYSIHVGFGGHDKYQSRVHDYPCVEFVEGKLDGSVLADMKEMISSVLSPPPK